MCASRLARWDAVAQGYVDRGQVAGIVSLLARHGVVAHAGCYGTTAPGNGLPMQLDTLFAIFSMTKAVTSAAVMMLFEEGRVRLTDPVAAYLPAFAGCKVYAGEANGALELVDLARPITIHDLMIHVSGLAYGLAPATPVDVRYIEEGILRMDEPLAEKVARIAALPLLHQPGERWTYSVGTDVLGHVVEVVAGQPLDAFLRERLFAPLGMEDTGFSASSDKAARLARIATPGPDGALIDVAAVPEAARPPFLVGAWVEKEWAPAFLSGGGGLISSAPDYLRFAQLLANGGVLEGTRVLSRKTVALMTTNHLPAGMPWTPGFGLGFGVTTITDAAHAELPVSAGAFGGGGAAGTEFWVDPGEGLVGVLMIQFVAEQPLLLGQDFKVLAAQAVAD